MLHRLQYYSVRVTAARTITRTIACLSVTAGSCVPGAANVLRYLRALLMLHDCVLPLTHSHCAHIYCDATPIRNATLLYHYRHAMCHRSQS
jgi:hypothetical protein